MLNFKNILVARDYAPCSERAYAYALDLAEKSGAAVHTLFAEVIHGPVAPPSAAQSSEEERTNRHVVRQAVVRDVAAAPAILEYARENDIDLIVMGTHGRRGLQRLFLGSVAEEVIRLSSCPVLTVRSDGKHSLEGTERILVPIDFSAHSEAALGQAVALAREFKSRLNVLHIIEEPLHPAFYNTGVFSIYDIQPDIEARVEDHLREMIRRLDAPDVEVEYHVQPGHPAREIIAFAEEMNPDLIVMATHGLTGIEHLLLGSVAEKVSRMAPCPVFVLNAFGHNRPIRTAATEREESIH